MSARPLMICLVAVAFVALACADGPAASPATPAPVNCDDEAACIALSRGSVTHEAGVLQITPAAGPPVTFRDAAPDCQMNLDPEDGDPVFCPQYQLTQYLLGPELWIVDGSGEGSIVVSGKSGETLVEKSGDAVFSPGGSWLSLFESEGEAQHYSIDIRSTSNDALVSTFRHESDTDEMPGFVETTAMFIGWKDDDRLELGVNVRNENSSETTQMPAFVVHSGTAWKLERSWEK